MRPLDIIDTRAGTKVEIGNTDAEGRLVLADAITYALEDAPDFSFTAYRRGRVCVKITAFLQHR